MAFYPLNSDSSAKFEKYNDVELIQSKKNATDASMTYTATESMDGLATFVYVIESVGGGNYTTTLDINERNLVSSKNDLFLLNRLYSRFVHLNKGDTIKFVNKGNKTTASDYPYDYESFLYKFKS